MCKHSSLSRYQKRVVKFLTDYCSTTYPFTYEKAQNNHLKVLIAGVPKPLYTGSTPSDRKSINNFIAEVKRAIREINTPKEATNPVTKAPNKVSSAVTMYLDKLAQTAIKTLRGQVEVLTEKEEKAVLEQQSIDVVDEFRSNLIKKSTLQNHGSKRTNRYLKHREYKVMEQNIRKHLDFMLPTRAFYAELLDGSKVHKTKAEVANKVESLKTAPFSKKAEQPKSVQKREVVDEEPKSKKARAKDLGLTKIEGRVERLRRLSKVDALSLIDDINEAMQQNYEADIAQVVALIKEKGLSMDKIAQSINAAAA